MRLHPKYSLGCINTTDDSCLLISIYVASKTNNEFLFDKYPIVNSLRHYII